MKVKKFEVHGLFNKNSIVDLDFNDDINIITGRNGAGKTTVMKLMWYLMSGNIEIAIREINFHKVFLETDLYALQVVKINRVTCRVEFGRDIESMETYEDEIGSSGELESSAEDIPNQLLLELGGSVFLPTFRRIEGGFTLGLTSSQRSRKIKSNVEEALVSLSRSLSNYEHKFVTSISSVDIVDILLKEYADLSQLYNDAQRETSQEIINSIKLYKKDVFGPAIVSEDVNPEQVLDRVQVMIESLEEQRVNIMNPIESFRSVVEKLFKHVGIKIDSRLSFGDAASAVSSEELSAGEKQMLSFLCYNAFHKNSVFLLMSQS